MRKSITRNDLGHVIIGRSTTHVHNVWEIYLRKLRHSPVRFLKQAHSGEIDLPNV